MGDVVLFSVSLGITVLGLLGSWRAHRRRGTASAMRGAAWSLVPMAAYLTGLTAWAAGLVFSPVKWAGIGLLGLACVLYVTSGVMLRRRIGAGGAATGRARGRTPAEAGEAGPRGAVGPRHEPAVVDPDLADVEEILRRRGIG
jgi:hypothetical protein